MIPYTPPSKYPTVSRDLTIQVPVGVTYQKVEDALKQALAETLEGTDITATVEPVSIYTEVK